jgi:hypothetical protein
VQIPLNCPHCGCDFVHEPEFGFEHHMQWATVDVVWDALCDGGTIEDSLHAALADAGGVRCPDCEGEVPVDEDDLGRAAMAMLECW